MMKPLLVLALLVLAAASGAADGPSAAPGAKQLKKRAKSSPQAQGASAGARIDRRKTGFERPGEGPTGSGTGAISGGGEFVLGAGVSKGAADKAGGANRGSSSSGGGGGGSTGGSSAAPAPSKSFDKAKVLTSNSPSGPFTQDGTVCATGQVYTRTTGLDRNKPPMGCASPFESNDCMDVKNHRKFEPGEWLDPFTIQTVVNGGEYPIGKYGMYLSFSKTDVKRVGFATLKTCAAPAKTCRWETYEAVIGPCGGPGCSGNVPCTTSNQGATGKGGGGTWTCVCK